VPRARMWWFVALLAVPAALAALALLWAGPPTPSAPPVAARVGAPPAEPPGAALPGPASAPGAALPGPASASAPGAASDPAPAQQPDPTIDEVTQVLATQPVRFTADSAVLTGPAADTVRRAGELLAAGPAVPVLVEGHVADTPGGPDAVQRLSDQRAAVVAQALVAAGVPAERITARGAGATRPLATVEESRRVEITVG
jgi:outer membrane protein OmpA-like peptidoglycan-associated protein